MVCDRCKMAVKSLLSDLGLHPVSVELGRVIVADKMDGMVRAELVVALERLGFALLQDRQQRTIDQIKTAIIELVHYHNAKTDVNLSAYIANRLGSDYSALSRLFSECTGITIERFFILQRIERVKELLFYGEMSLSEIAHTLNYSSVAYLSAQFKATTGMTPSQFKLLKGERRKGLDDI